MAPETELMLAVQYGTLADVKKAPRELAGQKNAQGMTALMLAVLKNDVDKVRYLLTLEDPAERNVWGLSAADLALKTGNERILDLLQTHCRVRGVDLEPSQTRIDNQFKQHILKTKMLTGLSDEELRRRTDVVASHTAKVAADFQLPGKGGAERACEARGVRPEYYVPGRPGDARK